MFSPAPERLTADVLPSIAAVREAHERVDPEGPVKVLFLGGAGRSGSTLIDRLLGQFDGFVSIGELSWIFEVGLRDNFLCGCGLKYHDCPFWIAVFEDAFGGMDTIDAVGMQQFWHQNHLLRGPNRNHFLTKRGRATFASHASDAAAILEALYRAIRKVSGARVIVDTSKPQLTPILMRPSRVVDLHVAHLVRDPRAVAYSWATPKQDPTQGEDAIQDRRPLTSSSAWWMATNVLSDKVRAEGREPSRLIRYEDFTENPARELRALAAIVGEDIDAESMFEGDGIPMKETHSVWGNPMRFAGRVQIKRDDRWHTEMRPRDQRIVEALTWPLMRRYHYPLGSGGR